MARLIDADAFIERFKKAKTLCAVFPPEMREVLIGMYDEFIEEIGNQPTVDAVEVVHGWWKGYVHSALVRWKDGEPVWADRNVYRCSRCDFGTIAKHNYCPNCGAKMDGGKDNERKAD